MRRRAHGVTGVRKRLINLKNSNMKKLMKRLFYYPWLMKNKVECTVLLHETIVLQMYKAGIKLTEINKWLQLHRLPQIAAYTVQESGQIRVFWNTVPTAEERRTIHTRIVEVR